MIYTLKTESGKYIHSYSKLNGSYIHIYLTYNLEDSRLLDLKTARRYKTLIDKREGERAEVWERAPEEGRYCQVEKVSVIGIDYLEVLLSQTDYKPLKE